MIYCNLQIGKIMQECTNVLLGHHILYIKISIFFSNAKYNVLNKIQS